MCLLNVYLSFPRMFLMWILTLGVRISFAVGRLNEFRTLSLCMDDHMGSSGSIEVATWVTKFLETYLAISEVDWLPVDFVLCTAIQEINTTNLLLACQETEMSLFELVLFFVSLLLLYRNITECNSFCWNYSSTNRTIEFKINKFEFYIIPFVCLQWQWEWCLK